MNYRKVAMSLICGALMAIGPAVAGQTTPESQAGGREVHLSVRWGDTSGEGNSQLDDTTGELEAGLVGAGSVQVSCVDLDAGEGVCTGQASLTILDPNATNTFSLLNVGWDGGALWVPSASGLVWTGVVNIIESIPQTILLDIQTNPLAPTGPTTESMVLVLSGDFTTATEGFDFTVTGASNLTATMPDVHLADTQGAQVPMPITLTESV